MSVEDARPQVLDHAVGLLDDEPAQARGLIRIGEIDGDAFLAAVQRGIGRRRVAPEWRAPAAGIVTLFRIFDLDDARAEIGEDQTGIGRRDAVSEFDDDNAIERPWMFHASPLFCAAD